MIRDAEIRDEVEWLVDHELTKLWKTIKNAFPNVEEFELRNILREQVQYFI